MIQHNLIRLRHTSHFSVLTSHNQINSIYFNDDDQMQPLYFKMKNEMKIYELVQSKHTHTHTLTFIQTLQM